jgi:hypothetical protein
LKKFKNLQTSKSTFTLVLYAMVISLIFSISISNVYAAPNAAPSNADCGVELSWDGPSYAFVQTCCWTESDPADPEGIELYFCQMCDYNPETKTASGCGEKYPQGPPRPPSGPVAPQQEDVLEQPSTENAPPIRSDNSVGPNDDNNAIDEQQSTNPTFNPNKGTISEENLVQDQPIQFSSNDEQSQETEESIEENNVETASNSQENDETSNSETPTSLSKRGNTQNSPVPPECPKQGPIPPDCTMKPKF